MLGSDTPRINSLVESVSTNGAGLFSSAGNGNIIDQNGQEVRADELVESVLFDIHRIVRPSSRVDGDAITEEFRPLALNAVNNLITVLNQ